MIRSCSPPRPDRPFRRRDQLRRFGSLNLASVNSSTFFDVSSSRAKDSGFDIYTADPSGVDTVFGAGLSDAGLTAFQMLSVDVKGGSPLQLSFTIRDAETGSWIPRC